MEICQYLANNYPQMFSCRPEEDSSETGGWIFHIRKKKKIPCENNGYLHYATEDLLVPY